MLLLPVLSFTTMVDYLYYLPARYGCKVTILTYTIYRNEHCLTNFHTLRFILASECVLMFFYFKYYIVPIRFYIFHPSAGFIKSFFWLLINCGSLHISITSMWYNQLMWFINTTIYTSISATYFFNVINISVSLPPIFYTNAQFVRMFYLQACYQLCHKYYHIHRRRTKGDYTLPYPQF